MHMNANKGVVEHPEAIQGQDIQADGRHLACCPAHIHDNISGPLVAIHASDGQHIAERQRRPEKEKHKGASVRPTHAVSDEGAVMVHAIDTSSAYAAVVTAGGFALPAPLAEGVALKRARTYLASGLNKARVAAGRLGEVRDGVRPKPTASKPMEDIRRPQASNNSPKT